MWNSNQIAMISITLIGLVSILGLFSAYYIARSALMSASITLLLLLVLSSWWYVANKLQSKFYPKIIKYMLVAGVIYGVLCIIQFFISSSSGETLGILCKNCADSVLGFPRINLFTAEPQFLASSLIPFFFVSLTYSYSHISKLSASALLLTSISIGLTFSRGAFLAITIGVLFFLGFTIYLKKFSLIKTISILFFIGVGIFLSFSFLFGAAINKYSQTPNIARDTANTMLGQLSVGKLKLPEEKKQTDEVANNVVDAQTTTFVSPGYIEASANERLSAADLAIEAWKSNTNTIIFGVGAGNLGPYVINNIDKNAPNNLTVYIFYILVLAELGIIGVLSLLALSFISIYSVIKANIKQKKTYNILLIALPSILLSFTIQYLFFGTFINTVYIWLFIGIALGVKSMKNN